MKGGKRREPRSVVFSVLEMENPGCAVIRCVVNESFDVVTQPPVVMGIIECNNRIIRLF